MPYYEDIVIIKDEIVMCLLCKIHFPEDDIIIETHLCSENHTKLSELRLMVQNNIVNVGNYFHCFICNDKLVDLSIHIQNLNHKKNINAVLKLIEKDGAFLELPQNIQSEGKAHCTICDRVIEFNFEAISCHISGERHRRTRAMAVKPFNGIFSVEGSNDDLWCKICQVYFENYIETIFEHVDEDKDHNIRLKKILRLIEGQNITIDTYLTNATEDKATCHKCSTGVACNVDNLERHIKGKRHRS